MTAPLRLLVAYDGTDFAGFQVQPGQRTVQGVLEEALERLTQRPVRVRAAGRTDAGVHALGQVVAFPAVDDVLHPDVLHRAMPSLLPSDVAVVDAQLGPDDFDARFSARTRSYTYLLWCGETAHPLYRRHSLWVREPVDVRRLSGALRHVVGTHDFSSFARVRSDQDPERTILAAGAVEDNALLRLSVTGVSFLHQMVRSIVGSALQVATGRKPASWMREVLEARDRSAAGPVAPAHGLALTHVGYDDAPWPRQSHAGGWPWSDDTSRRESVSG